MPPTKWIQPSGPRDARVVVVGRDCGWEEMRDQRGFVGASGKLIWHPTRRTGAADVAGLPRSACLVTNVVNTQPPHNDWSKHDLGDIQRGSREALDLIAEHPRTLVVALGEQATALCLHGDPHARLVDSITNLRGYVFPDSACGAPVLVAVHPAFILRNWHPWWATFCWDWAKASRIVAQGGYKAPQILWEVAQGERLNGGGIADLLSAECMAIDIETSGTGCVAFAASADYALVFPGMPAPDHPHEQAIRLLLESDVPKVFQNGQFDVTMMQRAGWRVNNWRDDTMLMWWALEPLLAGQKEDARGKGKRRTEKGLRFLASLLTDFEHYKNYEFAHDEQQFELCAKDAMVTWAIWDELRHRLAAA